MTEGAPLLNEIENHLEDRGSGFICVLSSVAGDRGPAEQLPTARPRGGLSIHLQGLRNRLHRAGVRVITVKPGFVDTAMTYGRPGMFLVSSPESVARAIVSAIAKGKDVVYVPGFWRGIMAAIRSIPEAGFKKLRL